ncbi:outer membrane receptor protein [Duganella sp. Leaf126]|uniref:TonB-dependent receptor plug domain-containing protein n=1 Tax=Duganella sp. Leaf126 TaxID=1736266 RepID=UPI0006F84722|nr:TonB-dependent receptor [Duganella sp. Leaf126]KQQ32959.1 outer membrane receptor protein [Duganella sp. Leaf126]
MHKTTMKAGAAAVLSALATLATLALSAASAHAAPAAADNGADATTATAAAAVTPTDAAATATAAATTSVIVTGTRASGMKAENSASPIQVLDAASLQRTGQPDLIQALAQNLPSFTAQAFGGDTANLTLSARLRGLSPNNTLVLINGKRRHGTANLAVLGGPYQGGAAADLNYIPVAAIDHIEVLQDGAAAQYGSDAIAGVINIILKSNNHGGSATATGGGYGDGGGRSASGAVNFGVEPFPDAFLNVTLDSKYHGHSDRGGIDPRVVDPGNIAKIPGLTQLPGYPYLNKIQGDAAYHLHVLAANFGWDLDPNSQLYAILTAGRKEASAYENYRLPNRVPALYPQGFSPKEAIKQDDVAMTIGVKGRIGDWRTEISTTYGRDKSRIGVEDSVNASLFADTGASPTEFSAGAFIATQTTTTLEASREVDVGWSKPLTVAGGLEYRVDQYEIEAGDPASRYKEGSQSYPGFSLTDAGKHHRSNKAAYVDIAGNPIPDLTVDLAGRYEHFSDFGSARVGKLTSRYEVSPMAAVRGTLSNGFRAPTLAESYYSATNVGPVSAFVQLAPNSPGARLVGVNGLKAEKSSNISLGMVLNPASNLNLTLDLYQIKIRDRIVGSGALYGSGGAVNSPAVTAAILANGNVLDSTVSQTGINIFSNAVNTRSRGLEFVATLNESYGTYGRVDWSAAANYNKVEVTKINQAPTELVPQTLLDKTAISNLETASPKLRLNLGALWKIGNWTVNLREAIYGKSSNYDSEDGAVYHKTEIKPRVITDLEVGYRIDRAWSVAVGANNLFNLYPNGVNPALLADQRAALDNAAVTVLPSFSPFGINGGYYYARASYKF